MRDLNLNDIITLTTGEFQFLAEDAGIFKLRNINTNEILQCSFVQLVELTPTQAEPVEYRPHDTDLISHDKTYKADLWLVHMEELDTGVHPITKESRPEFSLKLPLETRLHSKRAELARAGLPASRATVMRQLKKYRTSPTMLGVVDGRSKRPIDRLSNVHPEMLRALTEGIERQARRSTTTYANVIIDACAQVRRLLPPDEAEQAIPSDTTLYRYLHLLAEGKYLTRSAKTRQSRANTPDRKMLAQLENHAGAQVQIDSTYFDAFVRVGDSSIRIRPILTIMVDVATRSILACTLRTESAKGVDHTTLLAHALTPHQFRPDKSAYRKQVIADNWRHRNRFLSDSARAELLEKKPYIHPRTIVIDNGRDFDSKVFREVAAKNMINIRKSAIHTPTDKAIVERTFGSIHQLFGATIPGYVGRSPEHRGYKPKEDELLTFHGLAELLDDWIINIWQNRQHSGLADPSFPHVKRSPNEMARAASRISHHLPLPPSTSDYIGFLDEKHVVISATGVQINNVKYDSDELHPFRGAPNPRRLDGKWVVKYDAYNPDMVWVLGPDNSWIHAERRDRDRYFMPHMFDTSDEPDTTRQEAATIEATVNGAPIHLTHSLNMTPHHDADTTDIIPLESDLEELFS